MTKRMIVSTRKLHGALPRRASRRAADARASLKRCKPAPAPIHRDGEELARAMASLGLTPLD